MIKFIYKTIAFSLAMLVALILGNFQQKKDYVLVSDDSMKLVELTKINIASADVPQPSGDGDGGGGGGDGGGGGGGGGGGDCGDSGGGDCGI